MNKLHDIHLTMEMVLDALQANLEKKHSCTEDMELVHVRLIFCVSNKA